jgi:hypothetical protein
MMKTVARFGFLIFALARTMHAQTSGVEPGDRVRFLTPSSKTFNIATVARLTLDSLALQSCPSCVRLVYPRSEVTHLDVYRVSNRGGRALTGLGLGALIGGVLGYVSARSCSGGADRCELSGLAIPAGALLGGIFGAITGFLTGYSWQPVTPTTLAAKLSVDWPALRRGGLGSDSRLG